jgi:hypothetical protein
MKKTPQRAPVRVAVVATLALVACSSQREMDAGAGGRRDSGVAQDAAQAPLDAALLGDAARLDAFVVPPASDVEVEITADNAYSFGYGTESSISTYVQGERATLAGEIFNCPLGEGPEHYTVPAASAPAGAYLYVVSWDDYSVTQGVIGQFRRAAGVVYSGDDDFEVCATGVDFQSSSVGPTQEEVNTEIARCNAGSGSRSTTSAGWVNTGGPVTPDAIGRLVVGEANESGSGGEFPQVCTMDGAGKRGVDAEARWMWYDPEAGSVGTRSPFRSTGSNTFRTYLIFRLPAEVILL